MQKYNMSEARAKFGKIISLVEHDQKILISKNGKTVAKIIPIIENKISKREFGTLRGKIKVRDDFDGVLPDQLLDDFYLGKI